VLVPTVDDAVDTDEVAPVVTVDVPGAGAGAGAATAGHTPAVALGHDPQTGAGAVYTFVDPHVNPPIGLLFEEDPPQTRQHCMSIICCRQFFQPQ